MIIYRATKDRFVNDVINGTIADDIDNAFVAHLGRHTSPNEVNSWKNSMLYMQMVVNTPEIPDEAVIAIEYQIPLTSKRVDFLITGNDANNQPNVVIVELKQWEKVSVTDKEGLVRTRFQSGEQEVAHPSYQAWSYAYMLENYNQSIRENHIALYPCAFLHNYDTRDMSIADPRYQEYIDDAPIFLKGGTLDLQDFIKRNIRYASKNDIVWFIENGRLKPSKQLADSISSMLRNNREFVLLDEQKVVYETALTLARKAQKGKKQVFIVEGGPGTGKSVIAIQLLAELTREGLVTQYVSKNSAPREVYSLKLKGDYKQKYIKNLFVGSGCFIDEKTNVHDALIVDEAHRLNEKSGLYNNQGDNQIKEIINAAKFSVFFVDDMQRVHINDIGKKNYISEIAVASGAEVHFDILQSQFRCNGSDGYPSWLENALQIRPTANIKLSEEDFDFKIFDDPNELFNTIKDKNKVNNKSRVVAGYCWDWVSKKNPSADDIVLPEFGFSKQWNLATGKEPWIMGEDSIEQIGCIHTCQGLELDYVGVIVGNDIRFENGRVITDVLSRSSGDRSVFGFKKYLEEDPEGALADFDEIIKNTYRTLMTRGMKGCYVYFCDDALKEHFQELLACSNEEADLGFRIEPQVNDDVRYIDFLPLYTIGSACRNFVDGANDEALGWVKVDSSLNRNMFLVKASGNAMSPFINDGDICLFKRNPSLTRNRIVLVKHPGTYDPDYKGECSIKQLEFSVSVGKDGAVTPEMSLKSSNSEPAIIINANIDYCTIFAEFVKVIYSIRSQSFLAI